MDSFCLKDSNVSEVKYNIVAETLTTSQQGLEREDDRSRRAFEWPAMDKVVREADEAKVKGCKEDIDTLLVFVRRFNF